MPTSNPALNDNIFEREIRNSRGGTVIDPSWGSPRDEVPPGVFGGTGTAPLPPPPPPGAWPPPGTPQPGGPVGGGPFTPAPDQVSPWPPGPPTAPPSGGVMRLGGVLSAWAVMLTFLSVAAVYGWHSAAITTGFDARGQKVLTSVHLPGWLFAAWIGGFGIAILTIFKPRLARVTGVLYAVAEGLLLGAISHVLDVQTKGIAVQAVGLTVGICLVMLFLYATRIIRVTDKLRSGIIAAMGAILLVYLVSIIAGAFGATVPLLYSTGPVGIGISLLIVGVAAFRLLLDFDRIERGIAMGAPRYMEWFCAFGLMMTLVWLYIEVLRLLSLLRRR